MNQPSCTCIFSYFIYFTNNNCLLAIRWIYEKSKRNEFSVTIFSPKKKRIQMKATEQYFSVVQFIMLYQVVLVF